MKNLIGLFMISFLILGGCAMIQQSGTMPLDNMRIIKTSRLVNQTENQTGVAVMKIVVPEKREIGPDAIIVEKEYLDNQLKALQLQYIIGVITLSEYLAVKEEAINDKNDPNFQENIAINIEEINTSLKSAQLDYILKKIILDEYLEKEREFLENAN